MVYFSVGRSRSRGADSAVGLLVDADADAAEGETPADRHAPREIPDDREEHRDHHPRRRGDPWPLARSDEGSGRGSTARSRRVDVVEREACVADVAQTPPRVFLEAASNQPSQLWRASTAAARPVGFVLDGWRRASR